MTKIVPVVSVMTIIAVAHQVSGMISLRLKPGRDKERLNGAENDGQITRPLVHFLPADLAFFLDLLHRRRKHRHQLHDDRRRNVRRHAESKNRDRAEVSAREQIENAEQRAGDFAPNLFEPDFIDPGRDVRARTDKPQAARA